MPTIFGAVFGLVGIYGMILSAQIASDIKQLPSTQLKLLCGVLVMSCATYAAFALNFASLFLLENFPNG